MKRTKICLVALTVALLLGAGVLIHGGWPLQAPPTGTWAPTVTPMAAARAGASGVLLSDGRVLITGGCSGGLPTAGCTGELASAEFLNGNGSFSAAPSMAFARAGHSSTVLADGRVLVAGGLDASGVPSQTAEIFDPLSGVWSGAPSLMTGRSNHTATVLQDGRILIAGGVAPGGPTASLEIYDPASGAFSLAASSLTKPRQNHAAALLSDGRVLIIGGWDGTMTSPPSPQSPAPSPLSSSDIYDPVAGAVTAGPAMSTARMNLTATRQLDGKVAVIGGCSGGVLTAGSLSCSNDLASIEVFDPSSSTWSLAPGTLATPRSGHLAFLLPHNNAVLIVGGSSNGTTLSSSELYMPWTGTSSATGSMSSARSGASGAPLTQDGTLLVAGGLDASGAALPTSEVYGFATVKSDKGDYAPGTIVTITGSGWVPGETVTLSYVESPNVDVPGPYTTIADANGNISDSEFSPDILDINIRFYLTASGSVSQAQTTFTDANNPTLSVTSIGPTGSGSVTSSDSHISCAATPGGNSAGTCKFTYSGNGSTTLTAAANTGFVFTGWSNNVNNSPACSGTGTCVANFSGNNATSVTATFAASQAPAFTSGASTTFTVGAPGTFTVTASGVPSPTFSETGTLPSGVTLSAAGVLSGTPAPGTVASYPITITASNGVVPNATQAFTLTVGKASSSTALASSSNPSVFGQSVTFTATVTAVAPASGTPTGTVTFNDNGTPIANCGTNGVVNLSSGSATCTPTSLSLGSHPITAVYGADTNFTGSTGSLTQTVNMASSSSVATSSVNPSVFGQSVTFTATVSAIAPGSGTPTGSVNFYDGGTCTAPGTQIGTTQTLISGSASVSTSSLSVATHTLRACYLGDSSFNSSTTGSSTTTTVSQAVNKASSSTAVALTSGTNPSVFDASVTFTATVTVNSPGSGTPTGTINFKSNGTTITGCSTQALNAGSPDTATCATTSLVVGSDTITAVYIGDTNFNTSTSGNLTQTVNQASTATGLTSSVNPSVFGQSVTFTATVTAVAPGGGTPAGNVSFFDGGTCGAPGTTLAANVALNGSGVATTLTSALTVTGSPHAIIGCYLGNTNYTASNGSVSQVVNQASTTTAVTSSVNPSVFGQSITFTATISVTAPGSGTPSGTVTFYDSGASIGTGTLNLGTPDHATLATSTLSVGGHAITAAYTSGDSNFNASAQSANITQTVNTRTTTTGVTLNPTSVVVGQSSTVTVTVTDTASGTQTNPQGTIALTSSDTTPSGDAFTTCTLAPSGANAATCTATVAVSERGTSPHTITATFAATDGTHSGSNGNAGLTVNRANTTTTVALTSGSNPSISGASVTFTATVSVTAPGSGTPTGTINFRSNGSTITGCGTQALNASSPDTATCTTTALAVGSDSITAVYSSDANFNASTSTAITQNVDTAPAFTSASSKTFAENNAGTFTVLATGVPSPTLSCVASSTDLLDPCTLPSGVSFNASTGVLSGTPATGTSVASPYAITFAATNTLTTTTQSFTLTIELVSRPSTPALNTADPDGIIAAGSHTFTGTAPAGSTVKIFDGATQIGSGTATGGNYSISGSVTTQGNHSITATATDTLGYVSAPSGTLVVTVTGAISATTLGVQSSNSPTTTLTQVATVAAGNTVIVAIAMDPVSPVPTVTVSDTAGNTYSKDADVTNGSCAAGSCNDSGVRTLIYSASVVHPLTSGTITVSTSVDIAATFIVANGLVSPPKDQSQTATGASTTPSSGNTAATAQADELLIGAIGYDDRTQGVTIGSGFTALSASANGGQADGLGVMVQPGFQVVHAAGQYAATGSGANSNKGVKWATAIVTYKIITPSIVSIVSSDFGGGTTPSTATFTVTFSEPVYGVDANPIPDTDFALVTPGITGASITGISTPASPDPNANVVYTLTVNTGSGNGTLQLNYHDDSDFTVDINNIPLMGSGAGQVTCSVSFPLACGTPYNVSKTVATTTAVSTSGTPSTYGASVTFTGAVSPNTGTNAPTGTIGFVIDSGVPQPGTPVTCPGFALPNSLCATYSTSSLTVNGGVAHTVQANYTHTGNFTDSTGSLSGGQTVTAATQTINFGALGNKTYGDAPFTVSATGGASGNAVTFASTTAPVCATSGTNGTTVTIVAAGSCSIKASQLGNTNYAAAGDVTQSYTVAAKTLTASIIGNPAKPYDGNTGATLTSANYSLTGLVGSESITVTQTTGVYDFKDVAAATTVTATLTGTDFTPGGGTVLGNYVLPTTASGPGHISAKTLTASIAGNPAKPYDGGTTATLAPANFSLSGLVGSESFTVTQTVGEYNSKDVVTANSVSASLAPGDFTPANGATATNYSLPTTASGAGQITPKTLTASITGDPTKPYDGNTGATLTSANFSLLGLVAGETVSVTKTSGTYNSKDVSTAANVSATLAGTDFTAGASSLLTNYSLPTTASGAGNISPVTLTYTADAKSRGYGAVDPTFTGTVAGFVGGENQAGASTGTLTFTSTAIATSPVGSYAIDGSGLTANGGNYTFVQAAANATALTITRAHLSVAADVKSKMYDGAVFSPFTATISGFVNSETDAGLRGSGALSGGAGFTGTATTAINASPTPYTITPTAGSLAATNYDFTVFNDGNLTINKATATIHVTGYSVTFDAAPHTATATATGVSAADLIASLNLTGTTQIAAGDYPSDSWSFTGGTNYNDDSGTVHDHIDRAGSTTVVTFEAGPYTYRGTASTATANVTGVGSLNSPVAVSYSGDCTNVTAANGCTATATFAGDTNHTGSSDAKSITINQAPASLGFGTLTFTFDGFPKPVTVTTNPASLSGVGITYNLSATAPSNAGSYTVAASLANTNYSATPISNTEVIQPQPVVIAVTDPQPTYDGNSHAANISIAPLVSVITTYNGSATLPIDPGSYAVVVTIPDPNYSGAGSGTLTIKQLDPALALALRSGTSEPSPYGTRVYFDLTTTNAVLCPTGTVNFYVDGSSTPAATFTLASTSLPACNNPTEFSTATLAPGPHSVAASYSGDTYYLAQTSAAAAHQVAADTTSVNLATSAGTVDVGDAVMFTATVTPINSVDNGASPLAGTVQFNEVTVDGHNNVTGTLSTLGTGTLSAGPVFTAAISDSSLTAGTHNVQAVYLNTDGNYMGSSSAVNLEMVNKITPTITWVPSVNPIVYGTALGGDQLNATVADTHNNTDLTGSGTITYDPAAGKVLAVGAYNLQVTFTPTDTATYTTQTAMVTINVSPATLTVTADPQSRNYGADNSTFTFQYSAFVNGESDVPAVVTTEPTCTTTATKASPVGTYDITCSGGAAPNYTFNYVKGTLTVNPAPLTITASSSSTNYGVTVPTVTASYNGLVNNDTVTTTAPACSVTIPTGNPVGTYTSSCSGAVDANYSPITYATGSVQIKAVSLTITASSSSTNYGVTVPTVTASYNGLVNNDTVTTTAPTCSVTIPTGNPVGTYTSSCSGAVDANYSPITYATGSVQIKAVSLTITASSSSTNYGVTVPTVTASYNGLVNNDTVTTTAPTCSVTIPTGNPVGTYTSSCSGAVDANYSPITYATGSVQIKAVSLTITASSSSTNYGVTVPTVTASYNGLVNNDTVTTTAPTCSVPIPTGNPVGTYTSSCSGAVDANYSPITYATGSVQIKAVSLTITASSSSTNYGVTVPTVTASYNGLVNNDTVTTTAPTCSVTIPTGNPVGTYTSSCSGAVDANYSPITYATGSVQIKAVSLTITASSSSTNYGVTVPTVTASYNGLVNNDTVTTTAPTCSVTIPTGNPVGTYTSSCSGAVDANYSPITYATGSVQIKAVSLTITASSSSTNYGVTVPTVTASYNGLVNNDTVTTTAPTCSVTIPTGNPVGTYTSSCSGAVDANYSPITYATGSVQIKAVSLTITASSSSTNYGVTVPTVTASYNGLVNNDTVTTTAPTCSVTIPTGNPVGTYTSSCSGAVDANYSPITYATGSVQIKAVSLTITASSSSTNYGVTVPTVTASYNGLVNNDTVTTTAPTCSVPIPTGNPVGTYTSSCGGAVDANYSPITYATGSVQIKAVSLTITASSSSTNYGVTVPTVTASYNGLVNNDTVTTTAPTCSVTIPTGNPVGTYTSSCSGAVDANYSPITYATGSVQIKAVSLTITASSSSTNYGVTVPTVTASYNGLVNNDTVTTTAPTCSVTIPTGNPVGTYTSSCSGAVDANYSPITYATGSVQIKAVSLTITASSSSTNYGVTVPTVTASYNGLVNNDTVTTTAPTCSVTIPTGNPVGTYTSSCSGAVDANYSPITYATGSVQIKAVSLTITASSSSTNYGVTVPTVTASYNGLVNNDTVTTTAPTCSVTIPTGNPVGTYTSSCSGAVDANYSPITYATGSVQIKAVSLTITASSSSTNYGVTVPTVTASYNGLVNNDTVTTTAPTCSVPIPTGNPVGTYTSSCGGAVDANYSPINYVTGSVQIKAVPLTITASSGSMTYGASPYVVGPLYIGPNNFVNGDTYLSLATQPTCLPAFSNTTSATTSVTSCSGAAAANYTIGYVTGSVMVAPATTSIAVLSSLSTSNWGDAVTLTATVSDSSTGSTGTPTGSLTFYNAINGATCASPGSSTVLASAQTLSLTGQASTSTNWLPVGTDNILACYNGDSNFWASGVNGSGPGTLTQTVIAAPLATLAPNDLSFGNLQAGMTSNAQTVTLCNGPSGVAGSPCFNAALGTAPLNLSISFTGETPTWFTQTNTCGSSIAVGGSCTVSVKFAPPLSSTGVASGFLTVTDDSGHANVLTSTQITSLTGAGLTSISDQSLYTNAIFATAATCGSITLSGGSTVNSFNSAQGYAASDANAGNVGTNGNLTLNGGKTAIYGTAYLPATNSGKCAQGSMTGLTTSGGAQMTGVPQQLAGPLTYPPPPAPIPAPPTTSQNISGSCPSSILSSLCSNGPGSKVVTLKPGTYGNVNASGGTTVHVTAGTYNLNSLTLSGKSTLDVDSGPVVVNLAGASLSGGGQVLDLSGGSIQNSTGNPNPNPANLQFTYGGSRGVNLSGGSGSYATVYAPNALVNISGGSDFFGSIIGNTITASGGTAIHYDSNLPYIKSGNTAWFNAEVKNVNLNGLTSQVKLYMTNSSVSFAPMSGVCPTGTTSDDPLNLHSTVCTLAVPNAVIVFNSAALKSGATTSYDSTNNRWVTNVAKSALASGNSTFLGGIAYPVPIDLPTGIQNVSWSAAFSSDAPVNPGISFQWHWGAAVYSQFAANGSLGVNPEDGSYNANSADPAGTPENEKQYVTFGGTGGGLSSYTGYPSTNSGIVPTLAPMSVSPSSDDNSTVAAGGSGPMPNPYVLTNNSSVSYTINSISIVGANSSDFTILTNTCPAGGALGVGGNCSITVKFAPTGSSGTGESARIVFNDGANNSPQTVYLTGTVQ